ncbi:DMT family transporter [Desulfoferrobacter suflitae]|uniref:DMT family transporter n=1 Tax=Desulfoferrobacter suflitae TaxID=2865782 RepID=UPI0021645AAB|nr:DMT family transporter [Desulfoferrobacter suflitae]MCK8600451.1 DMT family transporter [Desulfoferrobacter suflitae]
MHLFPLNTCNFHPKQRTLAILLMLAAASLFTCLNLIIDLLESHFRIWDIGFYRFFGGLVLLFILSGRHHNPYRGNHTRLLLIRGICGSVAFLSLVSSIRLLPVSTALVHFYTFPAFAAIFSAVLFGERISRAALMCIAVVLIGISILFDFTLSANLLGQLLAINGAVFAGLTIVLIRRLKANNNAAIIYLYFCTLGLIVCLPMYLQSPVFPADGKEWLLCSGIVLTSLAAQLAMNQGFAYCRSWEGGLFMTSEAVFTAAAGIMLLGDPLSWRFLTGGVLILGSVVAMNFVKDHQQTQLAHAAGSSPAAGRPVASAASAKEPEDGTH